VIPACGSLQTAPAVCRLVSRIAAPGYRVAMTRKTAPDARGNLAAEIARLTRLGLDPAQIAERLGVPVERVGASSSGITDSAPGDLGGRDQTAADSFPASDPPPGPGA
jgi:hypothetical protein